LFGVVTPVQYRLEGYGRWEKAEETIRNMYETSPKYNSKEYNFN
jgi:hypothetical protein